MFLFIYKTDGIERTDFCPTLGGAIDAAMMDFSSGMSHPLRIQDTIGREIFDYHDLHWMYSRTWNVEYDRTTGTVTQR